MNYDDLSITETYLDSPDYLAFCNEVRDTVKTLIAKGLPPTIGNLKRAGMLRYNLFDALESLQGTGEIERRQLGGMSVWLPMTRRVWPMHYQSTSAQHKAQIIPDRESLCGKGR